jgi:hypothetical protein
MIPQDLPGCSNNGACTALAVAGGKPWAAPHESEEGYARPVSVVPDERVGSLLLLNPASDFFNETIRKGHKDRN